MTSRRHPLVRLSKALTNLVALVLASPAAMTCWAEERMRPGAEGIFGFWSHVLAVMPGLPGLYVRRAFYSLTLRKCSVNCWIDFGAIFAHRTATVEDEVYIGAYSVVGSAVLRHGCMIGTRANLLSGSAQHELRDDGRWSAADPSRFQEIEIGRNAWVGEAAVVMANVGAGALVSAGAVVSADVPPGVVVAGNPARFVRPTRQTPSPAPAPVTSDTPVGAPYVGFVDWLKCLGMLLIVYGHVAGWAPLATLPPIYSKQLGVALFLFATGFMLSRETRSPWHVAFNRLFEVYVFGLALAVLMSVVTYVTQGRLQISNYAPLLGGVNVLFNFFPANPTTWFLGTYFHVIVLWAVVGHRLRVSGLLLALSLVGEIGFRTVLMQTAGGFVAYMALPNWITVFLFGYWLGRREGGWHLRLQNHAAVGAAVLLVAFIAVWSVVAAGMPWGGEFPFMNLTTFSPLAGGMIVSAMISALYLATTGLAFLAAVPTPVPQPVRFVARNTLVIFLAHMPVYYALQPVFQGWGMSRLATSAALFLVCVPGLGLLSEVIHARGWLRKSRGNMFSRLQAAVRAS